MIEMGIAQTAEERKAVYRFWYSVYVEEMGRYPTEADHENRLLFGQEDERSWLFYARDGDDVVASCRMSWGGDGFTARQITQYSLEPFLAELPAEALAIGERAMVAASHRGGTLYGDLGATTAQPLIDHGVKLTFGASEPHLVIFYAELGMRPYADRHTFSEESGYLIPNVIFSQGEDAFGASPPDCVRRILRGENAVRFAHQNGADEYASTLCAAIDDLPADRSVFHGLTAEQVEACAARSVLVRCAKGDQILKAGGAARNPFVVLSGRLEARSGDGRPVELGPGALFGAAGLLANERRTADVIVTDDGTTVLALSERTLQKTFDAHPDIAAGIYANIARDLWARARATELSSG